MTYIDIFLCVVLVIGSMLFTFIGFKLGREFPKKCSHRYKILYKSNVIRIDKPGYIDRLCYCKCRRCGKERLMWVDSIQCTDSTEDINGFVTIKWEEH